MYAIFRGTVVCPNSIISSYSIFNVQKPQKKRDSGTRDCRSSFHSLKTSLVLYLSHPKEKYN